MDAVLRCESVSRSTGMKEKFSGSWLIAGSRGGKEELKSTLYTESNTWRTVFFPLGAIVDCISEVTRIVLIRTRRAKNSQCIRLTYRNDFYAQLAREKLLNDANDVNESIVKDQLEDHPLSYLLTSFDRKTICVSIILTSNTHLMDSLTLFWKMRPTCDVWVSKSMYQNTWTIATSLVLFFTNPRSQSVLSRQIHLTVQFLLHEVGEKISDSIINRRS